MVDKNIGVPAMNTNNVYIYKNKIVIPPLTMQDDTLGVSVCGFKSRKMNNFLNTRTKIMKLQFGSDKCEKLHIGKRHINTNICADFEVDVWQDKIMQKEDGSKYLVDRYIGKKNMKTVQFKKYLGQIIQSDGRNEKNVKDKTDKAFGNVSRIKNALIERPYGKHTFKAALIMRQAMLLGGLLSNSEAWTHLTEINLAKLQLPDTLLHKTLLSTSGNPSKVCMCLELGVIPVKYVIMGKRLNFLYYILSESISSTMRQVYETMKSESRKGDFYQLVKKDMEELNINMPETEILSHTKRKWKLLISKRDKEYVFAKLVTENSKLENTKHIVFEDLKLSNYLQDNRNTTLSRIIFSVRSKTLDLKTWQPWKYFDNLCVLCEKKAETMAHFMSCKSYENVSPVLNWEKIYQN